MRVGTDKMRYGHLASVAVIAVCLSVGGFRLAASLHVRGHGSARNVKQLVPPCQSADNGDGNCHPLPLIHAISSVPTYPEVSTSNISLILRTHRIAFVPVPVRRLKLPSAQDDPF